MVLVIECHRDHASGILVLKRLAVVLYVVTLCFKSNKKKCFLSNILPEMPKMTFIDLVETGVPT